MRYELNFDEDKVNDVLCKGGASYDLKECCDLLNEKETIILNLKLRMEKINGGYGHLTHKKGLTPNEWLLNKQERELKKKDEQISNWIEQHSKDIAKISEQQSTINKEKELLKLIANACSFNKEHSVKEILRNEIKGIDTVTYESANAWHDYVLLSQFFEEVYEEHWDNE